MIIQDIVSMAAWC